jgi:hypothetical protein
MTPRIIPVGEELPPMDDDQPTPPDCRHRGGTKGRTGNPRRKPAGRFAVLNAFVDFSLAGLSRAEIAVWLVLYRDTRDGIARTSYDDLARRAGCNRRNVGRAIRRLERLGLLRIVHRGGFRRGVSRYRVRPLAREG